MNMENQKFSIDLFLRKTIAFYLELFSYILNGVKKHWKVSLLIGLICGLLLFKKWNETHTIYKANCSYTFNYLNKKTFGDLLQDISTLIQNGEHDALSKRLKISPQIASNMISLDAKNILGQPLHEDFSEQAVPFYIYITTLNKEIIPDIQSAITKYIVEDPFSVNRINSEHTKMRNRLDFLENEIKILDSLKVMAANSENRLELFELTEKKMNDKVYILGQLNQKNSVTLLRPFEPMKVDKLSTLKSIAIKYISVALFLSIFISSAIYWYQNPKHDL